MTLSGFSQSSIDAAVAQALPGGLPAGKKLGVVGVVNPHGVQGVATVALIEGALSLQGYVDHEWIDENHDGKQTDFGGRLLFVL